MSNIVALRTGYRPETGIERPISRAQLAAEHGVCPKTVDRWVSRDGMPQDTEETYGAWVQSGAQRRFYPVRVRAWLAGGL